MLVGDMIHLIEDQTAMFKEAGSAPARVETQLNLNQNSLHRLGQRLRQNRPKFVMICARGSSSHAGIYARYMIETRLGIPVLPVAPSLSSIFAVKQDLDGVLFLAISQSGQSPDILSAAQAAKNGGAFVVAIVNDEHSPLAQLAEMVVPLHAELETSVAATKTFICTLSAIAQMVAEWAQLDSLTAGLHSLPGQLEGAFDMTWDEAIEALKETQSLFTISRGLGLCIAKEAALKFKETCCLHAEAFSAAEVRHGPIALVKDNFPVIIFSTGDETQASIDAVTQSVTSRSTKIFVTGRADKGARLLSTVSSEVPELRPILAIQSFYRFINALSLSRGLNPDAPDHLKKITETL